MASLDGYYTCGDGREVAAEMGSGTDVGRDARGLKTSSEAQELGYIVHGERVVADADGFTLHGLDNGGQGRGMCFIVLANEGEAVADGGIKAGVGEGRFVEFC